MQVAEGFCDQGRQDGVSQGQISGLKTLSMRQIPYFQACLSGPIGSRALLDEAVSKWRALWAETFFLS
jgi:hypothetical protein